MKPTILLLTDKEICILYDILYTGDFRFIESFYSGEEYYKLLDKLEKADTQYHENKKTKYSTHFKGGTS